MSIRPVRTLTRALLLSAALAGTAAAQEAADTVVATVNGDPIYRSEVVEAIAALPPQYQQVPVEVLIPAIAEQVAIGRVIVAQAEAAGIDDDPDVLGRLALARTNILQEVWLQTQVDEQMTEEAVADAYQTFLGANPAEEEISARHILVETEEDAIDLIGQLDDGADFGTLAREHSIGPSGAAGGDLGWFRQGQMVQPFGDAAFALEVGTYTAEPVQTQFGWHVIILDDRRMADPPALEDVRGELEGQLAQQFMQELIEQIRAGADIQLVDADATDAETSAPTP